MSILMMCKDLKRIIKPSAHTERIQAWYWTHAFLSLFYFYPLHFCTMQLTYSHRNFYRVKRKEENEHPRAAVSAKRRTMVSIAL